MGQKKIGSEIFWGHKNLGQKKFWVKKNRVGNFCLGEKKVGNFSGLKGFGSEIWFGQILFWSYMNCLCCFADYCRLEQQQHRV